MLRAVALFALFFSASAGASTATLTIESLSLPLGELEGVEVRVTDEAKLQLTAKRLDAPALGYRFTDLRWRCDLAREGADAFRCRGPLRARDAGTVTLAATWKAGAFDLALSKGEGSLALAFAEPMTLRGIATPATWLQPLLAARWPEGTLTAGRLDTALAFGTSPAGGVTMQGPLAVRELGLDTRDGRIAAASLAATGHVSFAFDPDATVIDTQLQLAGGEVLAGPLYAALPTTPIAVNLAMRSDGDTAWMLQRAAWQDPGVLEIDVSGTLDVAEPVSLASLDATIQLADLAKSTPRYFDALFGTFGLEAFLLTGSADIVLARRDARWTRVDATLRAIGAKESRFEIAALDGQLAWSADAPVDSELRWDAAAIHDLTFGPARFALRSEQAGLALTQPVAIDLLGGTLSVPRFAWRDGTLDAALALRGIEVAQLSTAFGWPAFTGRLDGDLPALRYANETLSFDGGLQLDAFGGDVGIARLTLERPFGVAPTLTADVAIDGLDLAPLTGAFGFGEITGRLDGRIDALRVVDWQPVAFDADLHTDSAAKGPRRISRRAVQDLSSVGGAGIAAGLQTQVMKLFDTFPYARIGLRCRLADNVCEMGGLDSSKGGYTIVEGSGLPRITVVGHQQRVDWPVLVARLKAATEGQAPIVE